MIVILLLLLLTNAIQDTKAELFVAGSNNVSNNRFIVDAVIRQLFEMFKEVIKNGNEEHGLPVLDPYKLEDATFELVKIPFQLAEGSTGFLAVNISFDGLLYGLGDYQLGSFTFTKSDISMDLELHYPKIKLKSDYGINVKLLEVSHSGKGFLELQIEDIIIKGKVFLKQSDDGKSVLLSHFNGMQFSIGKIMSGFQYDNNTDKVINAMTEELLPGYLSNFSKFICVEYGEYAIRLVNAVLSKMETWYIIAAVLGK